MRRIYHNQKFRIIPRVIVNYAVAISRSKYPLLRFTNKIEFLCGYNIIKGANKKRPIQTGYDSVLRASRTNSVVLL